MFENTFKDFRKIQEDTNRLFQDIWKHTTHTNKPGLRSPPIDIREERDEIIASIEIPGAEEKDIRLKIHPDKVGLKVERKVEKRVQTGIFIHNERKYRAFYRSFPLPKLVVPKSSSHSYKNGVLKIIMPKAE